MISASQSYTPLFAVIRTAADSKHAWPVIVTRMELFRKLWTVMTSLKLRQKFRTAQDPAGVRQGNGEFPPLRDIMVEQHFQGLRGV